MNNALMVICGPTATGKTRLGLKLAKIIDGEIVAADSRQVYEKMDIGTGKDLPKLPESTYVAGLKCKYYTIDKIKVWGYDLSRCDKEYSVSDYFVQCKKIINNIWKRGKTPIIVGGSGLYLTALIDGIDTINISRNVVLRNKLKNFTVDKLSEMLKKIDINRFEKMNNSDRFNPRRLTRAIEICLAKTSEISKRQITKINYDHLLILGLKANKNIIDKKIEERVYERINNGFETEVQNLINEGIDWSCQSMSGMGYRQYKDYFYGKTDRECFIRDWIAEEKKYAKRQMTWFKKDKRIIWYDISDKFFEKEVENKVRNWYYLNKKAYVEKGGDNS